MHNPAAVSQSIASPTASRAAIVRLELRKVSAMQRRSLNSPGSAQRSLTAAPTSSRSNSSTSRAASLGTRHSRRIRSVASTSASQSCRNSYPGTPTRKTRKRRRRRPPAAQTSTPAPAPAHPPSSRYSHPTVSKLSAQVRPTPPQPQPCRVIDDRYPTNPHSAAGTSSSTHPYPSRSQPSAEPSCTLAAAPLDDPPVSHAASLAARSLQSLRLLSRNPIRQLMQHASCPQSPHPLLAAAPPQPNPRAATPFCLR